MQTMSDNTPSPTESAATAAAAPVWIDNPADLSSVISNLLKNNIIGMDTEFVRERTYWPRPGLLQLSDGDTVWLVDLTVMDDYSEIRKLIENPEIVKVIHSPGEDLEVIRLLCGALPRPLFDTQIAAACLGSPLQMGYENLLEQELGVCLEGGKARSNWLKRPLDEDLKAYAAQDVAWLPLLQQHLGERLRDRERLGWVLEECNAMLEAAESETTAADLVARIRGAGRLDDTELGRLAALAAWRDREARRRDLPRSFVAKDEHLIRLARDGQTSPTELADTPELPESLLKRYAGALATALAEGAVTDFQRPAALAPLDSNQRQRLKTLQARVAEVAGKLGIEASLLASKRELTRFLHGDDTALARGWRAPHLASALDPEN